MPSIEQGDYYAIQILTLALGLENLDIEEVDKSNPIYSKKLDGDLGAPGDRQEIKGASPSSEGVATHTVPESCVQDREVMREALTGVVQASH